MPQVFKEKIMTKHATLIMSIVIVLAGARLASAENANAYDDLKEFFSGEFKAAAQFPEIPLPSRVGPGASMPDVPANGKCLNDYRDVLKFAAGIEGDEGDCSGYYIKPNLVLTARHCIGNSGTAYVTPIRTTHVGQGSDATVIARSSEDIVLLKTEEPHPELSEADFRCIETRGPIPNGGYVPLHAIGTTNAHGVYILPLSTVCRNPSLIGFALNCPEMLVNVGQSGSALVGLDSRADRIYVYGVISRLNGINSGGVFYANRTVGVSVEAINLPK